MTENNVTTTTEYTYHGKLLTGLTQGSDVLHFYYDKDSRPQMVDYNGTMYYYVHNLQGDIIAIEDDDGIIQVEYTYDAWGNSIEMEDRIHEANSTLAIEYTMLANISPFRYRGYLWDSETRLYYLRSRYYDPNTCRFINQDAIIGTRILLLGYNGFCYTRNCPIVSADANGYASCYILYDGRPDESDGGKGFPIQANWWLRYLTDIGYSVDSEAFSSVTEFIEDWNNMPDGYDYLLIIAHGAEGTLDCNGERLAISYAAGHDYPITHLDTQLNSKTVKQMTVLLTCHGATSGYNGVSLANIIADKTQSVVYAAKNAKVNYYKGTGWPYLSNNGFWKTLGTILFWGYWSFIYPQKGK